MLRGTRLEKGEGLILIAAAGEAQSPQVHQPCSVPTASSSRGCFVATAVLLPTPYPLHHRQDRYCPLRGGLSLSLPVHSAATRQDRGPLRNDCGLYPCERGPDFLPRVSHRLHAGSGAARRASKTRLHRRGAHLAVRLRHGERRDSLSRAPGGQCRVPALKSSLVGCGSNVTQSSPPCSRSAATSAARCSVWLHFSPRWVLRASTSLILGLCLAEPQHVTLKPPLRGTSDFVDADVLPALRHPHTRVSHTHDTHVSHTHTQAHITHITHAHTRIIDADTQAHTQAHTAQATQACTHKRAHTRTCTPTPRAHTCRSKHRPHPPATLPDAWKERGRRSGHRMRGPQRGKRSCCAHLGKIPLVDLRFLICRLFGRCLLGASCAPAAGRRAG